MAALYRHNSGLNISWTSREHLPVNNVLYNDIAHAVLDKTLLCWVTWPLRTAFRAYEFPQPTSWSEASPLYNSGLSYTKRLSCRPGDMLALFSGSSVAQGKLETCLYLPRTLQIFRSISEIAAGTLEEKDHTKPFSRALLPLSLVLMTKDSFLSESRVESPPEDAWFSTRSKQLI